MTLVLGGVSILELESQLSIIAIVHVDVGEWILEGGILRSDDVLQILIFFPNPIILVS